MNKFYICSDTVLLKTLQDVLKRDKGVLNIFCVADANQSGLRRSCQHHLLLP